MPVDDISKPFIFIFIFFEKDDIGKLDYIVLSYIYIYKFVTVLKHWIVWYERNIEFKKKRKKKRTNYSNIF